MIKFNMLHPNDMTEEEKLGLVRFMKWDIHQNRTASELVNFVLRGLYQMWRVEGDGKQDGVKGVLLTRVIRTDKGGRTLYMEGLMGRGFVEHAVEFGNALMELAKQGDCVSITGWVARPGMIKMVQKGGMPIVAQVFARKVEGASHAS